MQENIQQFILGSTFARFAFITRGDLIGIKAALALK